MSLDMLYIKSKSVKPLSRKHGKAELKRKSFSTRGAWILFVSPRGPFFFAVVAVGASASLWHNMRTKDLVRISVIAVLHLLFCVSHVCSTKKNNDLLLGPAPAKTNATLIGLKKNNQKRAPEGPIKLQVLGKPKKNPKPGPEPKKDTVSKRQAAEAEKTSTERVFREFSDIDVDL
ncbi:unnamed protein product [Notodromas monacha]|uniref:Uncharacterized protein n=1 Tax=Notodromas monacha TaxID=399045 RepID=A0A7R9BXJ0_9CRUS|nr:unnamed protein product [Notodromas monacha]CAG0922063.1 unnamed protein product [Notodromas monacha]